MIRPEIARSLAFCSNYDHSWPYGHELPLNTISDPDNIQPILDYWYPYTNRAVDGILEEFEYILERARLLALSSRPFLEFINSALIHLYTLSTQDECFIPYFNNLTIESYRDSTRLPLNEPYTSKITSDLSQFVVNNPKLNLLNTEDGNSSIKDAINLSKFYLKFRGLSNPNVAFKLQQLDLLENKILISDLKSLQQMPLICSEYIDEHTTDPCLSDKRIEETSKQDTSCWLDRNGFISYIKSTGVNIFKIIRCAISSSLFPIHCVWAFTGGFLDFDSISMPKSPFQPLMDMVCLSDSDYTWSHIVSVKDKVELLYPLERFPEYKQDNYIDSLFKMLPHVVNVNSTNYSPLKIKVQGQDGFQFGLKQVQISNELDKSMMNYVNTQNDLYDITNACAVVTLKTDVKEEGSDGIDVSKNPYTSNRPRYSVSLHADSKGGIESSALIEECAKLGVKHLIFLADSRNLAYLLCKSLCTALEKRAKFTASPWYNRYFGINIHMIDNESDFDFLNEFHEFIDQRTLIY